MAKSIIDTPEKLNEYLTEQEREISKLKDNIRSLTVLIKGGWKDGGDPEVAQLKTGDFIQHLIRRDTKGLNKMGAIGTRDVVETGDIEPIFDGKFRTKAGMATTPMLGDDSDTTYYGGYLVPKDTLAELNRIAADNSAMMGLVRHVPVRGITSYLPTTTDELAFTDQSTVQDTDQTAETLTIGRTTLTVRNFYAYLPITEEYAEDSLVSLGQIVNEMFGEAWGTRFDSECLEHATYGVLGTAGVNQRIMSAGSVAFGDVGPDDLLNLIAELNSKTKRRKARFFMHPTVFDHVRRMKNAVGDFAYQKPAEGQPGTIWAYSYTTTDGLPSSTDTGVSTDFIVFGNPIHIVNAVRIKYEFKVFDQTQSTMVAGQIFLRCRCRHGFALSQPGGFAKLTTAAA